MITAQFLHFFAVIYKIKGIKEQEYRDRDSEKHKITEPGYAVRYK